MSFHLISSQMRKDRKIKLNTSPPKKKEANRCTTLNVFIWTQTTLTHQKIILNSILQEANEKIFTWLNNGVPKQIPLCSKTADYFCPIGWLPSTRDFCREAGAWDSKVDEPCRRLYMTRIRIRPKFKIYELWPIFSAQTMNDVWSSESFVISNMTCVFKSSGLV